MNRDKEFAVFDSADFHEITDEDGWLYGLRLGSTGEVLVLGIWNEQIAEFPFARPGETWHGYPKWPLKDAGPQNRRGEKHRPAKSVFLKMEAASLISTRDRKRLQKGDHV
jgi:hypothetical protein